MHPGRGEVEPDEQKEERIRALERRALSARAVHEALRSEGASEIGRPWNALAWSGLAAGISMGLSLVAEGFLRAHMPDASWRPLVASLGYTVGFVVVTLGRQQLFTETTLTACLPLLHERTASMLVSVVRLWVVVLFANLVGGWLFAWTASHPSATMRDRMMQMHQRMMSHMEEHMQAGAQSMAMCPMMKMGGIQN
jgi:formate-nitrite transporter family protein